METSGNRQVELTRPDLWLCRGDVISSMSRQNRSHASGLRLVQGEGDGERAAPPLTDAQLVLALREEEAGAAAELWTRCSPAVARLLGKTLGPGPEIRNTGTQEVFLRFFVRLASLRDPTALRAFIFSVAMTSSNGSCDAAGSGARCCCPTVARFQKLKARRSTWKHGTRCDVAIVFSTRCRPMNGWLSCAVIWRE